MVSDRGALPSSISIVDDVESLPALDKLPLLVDLLLNEIVAVMVIQLS